MKHALCDLSSMPTRTRVERSTPLPSALTKHPPTPPPLPQVLFTLMLGLLYSIKPAPSLGTFR